MLRLTRIQRTEIRKILDNTDSRDYFIKTPKKPDSSDLSTALEGYIRPGRFNDVAVLGVDIYRYGQYGTLQQVLIPFLFHSLYQECRRLCLMGDQYLFQSYKDAKGFEKHFIDTGDGGFQLFDNPLLAIAFALNLQIVIRAYNSYHYYPKLRSMLDEIELRYALTYDKVYRLGNNRYGPGIINNARVMAKDLLNRFLIDQNTYEWFMLNINGVENLSSISLEEIAQLNDFKTYDKKLMSKTHVLFSDKRFEPPVNSVKSVDVQKIDTVRIKEGSINIFNLHVQLSTRLFDEKDSKRSAFFNVSLGNLNTSGLA